MSLADAVATAPRRQVSSRFWHQGPTRHPLTSCADPARGPGRYHRTGEPGVWYASSQEQASWAELFRHFIDDGVDPFEVRRRVGRVYVVLEVLDLTDEAVRAHLGVDESDLVGDDYSITQAIAAAARDAGLHAPQLPRSQVARPWPSSPTPCLLPLIRPHERVPDTVRRLYLTLARAGAGVVRARRRRN